MFNARFLVDWIEFFKRFLILIFLDLELEGKYQTCDVVEGDSVEDDELKTLSRQVVESILMDLLTKMPFKDDINRDLKEMSNEGMHT